LDSKKFQQLMLEHMAKITQELSDLKGGQDELRHGHNELRQGHDELRQAVARIEYQHGEKLAMLFDAREVQNSVNEKILSILGHIEAQLDVLQKETAHIRRIK